MRCAESRLFRTVPTVFCPTTHLMYPVPLCGQRYEKAVSVSFASAKFGANYM